MWDTIKAFHRFLRLLNCSAKPQGELRIRFRRLLITTKRSLLAWWPIWRKVWPVKLNSVAWKLLLGHSLAKALSILPSQVWTIVFTVHKEKLWVAEIAHISWIMSTDCTTVAKSKVENTTGTRQVKRKGRFASWIWSPLTLLLASSTRKSIIVANRKRLVT